MNAGRTAAAVVVVVVCDLNGVIGISGGDMPWGRQLTADLRRFRQLTTDQTVIMGYNTFVTIGRPLPNRRNIVVARCGTDLPPGCQPAPDVETALGLVEPGQTPFIIGGARIYAQAMPMVGRIYMTVVMSSFVGDLTFPELDPGEWRFVSSDHVPKGPDTPWALMFKEYARWRE